MLNVYTAKRREPRVRLRTRVHLIGTNIRGESFEDETVTIDVSPRGASCITGQAVSVGAVVEFRALKYPFATRAIVRSCLHDRMSGAMALGLEFLDERHNPLIIWDKSRHDGEQTFE